MATEVGGAWHACGRASDRSRMVREQAGKWFREETGEVGWVVPWKDLGVYSEQTRKHWRVLSSLPPLHLDWKF